MTDKINKLTINDILANTTKVPNSTIEMILTKPNTLDCNNGYTATLNQLHTQMMNIAKSYNLAIADALEEEKGIDLQLINNDGNLDLFTIINDNKHQIHIIEIPDGNTNWLYIISPSVKALSNSVRILDVSMYNNYRQEFYKLKTEYELLKSKG